MKYRQFISLPLLALFLALCPMARASTTWYVDGVNGNDTNDCKSPTTACKTIAHAISLASSGDSIIVAAATYTENLTISFSLNVIGSGASTTIIDGGGLNRVITISSGNVTLSGLTIRHGVVTSGTWSLGAGIFNGGNLMVMASTITGNLASAICLPISPCIAGGGGIYNSGKLTLSTSTVAGNTAKAGFPAHRFDVGTAEGGGIFNDKGTMMMSNSTLVGNTVRPTSGFVHYYGGAISNKLGTAIISNSTLSANTSGIASVYFGSTVTLQNSIVSNNSGWNCGGNTMISKGYNLSSDNTCNFSGPGDLNNHDPLLGPLQNNGGPTETMALLPGSPAIDGGNPAGCTDGLGHLLTTDQRGMPRPDKEDSAGCDMGAYESQSD